MKRCAFISCLLLLSAVFSCKRADGNPDVKDLPGKEFTLSLTEKREKAVFEWTVNPLTGETDNGVESIKTLNITRYNTVELYSTYPVNVKSSNTSCVKVKALDGTGLKFELTYEGSDGDVTIEAWNGEGDGMKSQMIRLRAQWAVELSGLKFLYGENHRLSKNPYIGEPYPFTEMEEIIANRYVLYRPSITANESLQSDIDNEGRLNSRNMETDFLVLPYHRPSYWSDELQRTIIDFSEGALMRFVGPEPENASFRTALSFESEWDAAYRMTDALEATRYGLGTGYSYIEKGQYSWPNVYECEKDISAFTGAEMWMAACNRNIYMTVAKIHVKLPSGAGETRYYYLYHQTEQVE